MSSFMRNRILVVDDDPVVLRVFRQSLQTAGFDVVAVSSGEAGLEILTGDETIGLVLLDLEMPKMNGWAVRRAQLADRRIAHIPTIVITGSIDHAQRARSELRPQDYLLKPVTNETLIATVMRYCTQVGG
jgi:CheY-like chemotaxis protein